MAALGPTLQPCCSTASRVRQPFSPAWRQTPAPHRRQLSTAQSQASCNDAQAACCAASGRFEATDLPASSTSSRSSSSQGCTSSGRTPSAVSNISRRSLLAAALLAASGASTSYLLPAPAMASVTVSLKARSKQTSVTTKGGFELTVPSTWTMAYDRSESVAERGTLVLFANFKTLETLSISKQAPAEAGLAELAGSGKAALEQLTADQVADAVLAPERSNQSTYAFKLLAAEAVPGSPSSYLLEYVQQVCRGNITEGSGGTRRCTNPRNDADLQIVSRHYLQTVQLRPDGLVYSAKGSATSERWPEVAEDMLAAVQSFKVGTGAAA